jgi:hypothetical protein
MGKKTINKFNKYINNIPLKLNKMLKDKKERKFVKHLIYSFVKDSQNKTFLINKFDDYEKYKNIPKICSLTGFIVSDTTSKEIDEPTINYFKNINKKIKKNTIPLSCYGSTESNKLLSASAFNELKKWFLDNIEKEKNGTLKGNFFRSFIKNELKNKKKKYFDFPRAATYSIKDKIDLNKLKI